MKPIISTIVLAVCFSHMLYAQDKPPVYGWANTLVTSLNASWVKLDNWVQGGENTMAWTVLANGKFIDEQESFAWGNSLKITYGQTKLGSREFEKTDDELFFESVVAYKLGWKVNPYGALLVRSQLTPGYKIIDNVRTQTSGLFDPGYVQESVGFTYGAGEMFTTRLGVAFRELFSSEAYKFADDPATTKIESFKYSTGIESATSFKFELLDNVLYTSQLNLFSAFDKLDVWDVRWDNLITAKVNKYISTSLTVQVLHEVALSRRTQLKNVLALGVNYSIF